MTVIYKRFKNVGFQLVSIIWLRFCVRVRLVCLLVGLFLQSGMAVEQTLLSPSVLAVGK
jgi:hypothetical protein